MAIHFFQEDIKYNLPNKIQVKNWLKLLAASESYTIKELNYIFCSDEYLYSINVEHLQHDTYTDIITFDNSDETHLLEADIFISIERVKENAANQTEEFNDELLRVLSHGLYHLCGIGDKSPDEIKLMRSKENGAILRFKELSTTTVPRGTVEKH
jgi:probable rRNA maturation factor